MFTNTNPGCYANFMEKLATNSEHFKWQLTRLGLALPHPFSPYYLLSSELFSESLGDWYQNVRKEFGCNYTSWNILLYNEVHARHLNFKWHSVDIWYLNRANSGLYVSDQILVMMFWYQNILNFRQGCLMSTQLASDLKLRIIWEIFLTWFDSNGTSWDHVVIFIHSSKISHNSEWW